MGLGSCCCLGSCKKCGPIGPIRYHGSSALKTQPSYSSNPLFSSRLRQVSSATNYSGSALYTYDLKSDGRYVARAGGIGGRSIYDTLMGQWLVPLRGGPSVLNEGFEVANRYGWDNFMGTYGVEFWKGALFWAEGNSVSFAPITAYGNYGYLTWYESFSNTVVNKLAVHGDYLFVGTCGYNSPPSDAHVEPDKVFTQKKEFNQQYAPQGVKVYFLGDWASGKATKPKLVTTQSCGDVTAMASGKTKVFIGTRSGGFSLKASADSRGNHSVSQGGSFGSGIITAVDALNDDVYYTFWRSNGGGVGKNGSTIINTYQYERINWCKDNHLNCYDIVTGEEGVGYFANVIPNYFQAESFKSRTVLPICVFGDRYNSAEQLGTFPNGIGVGSDDKIVVSFWQQGFRVFTSSGSLLESVTDLVTNPENCREFDREKPSDNPKNANAEYTLSCGQIAVACGKVFIADSIECALGGSGVGWYSPVSEVDNLDAKVVYTKNWNSFGGIIEI